ncbi:DUF2812 domain-containing protein [Shouchella lonarensis]|uniref:DUF2812 domain-containing protein n=1 Tax=Shouchella lonarensis TaxID=1464122 RepID=A0A1G6MKW7_9BACI|nr:DUF2812 domain-containing protein [Shouchella lonarensis]SDC55595.1 Protein of unknown function [Shouchella lonarensis]
MIGKTRYFMDIEKEEAWLNKMREAGYQFVDRGWFTYYFKKVETIDSKTIKIDYKKCRDEQALSTYLQPFQEEGWKRVCGKSDIHYFEKDDPAASEAIFLNNERIVRGYKKLMNQWRVCATVFLSWIVILLLTGMVPDVSNPKSFFYTPGLWEKEGAAFLRAFLFELPFALSRMLPPYIIIFVGMLYAFLTVKTYRIYKRMLAASEYSR